MQVIVNIRRQPGVAILHDLGDVLAQTRSAIQTVPGHGSLRQVGSTATLLEWDAHIPSFDEVHGTALKANKFLSDGIAASPKRPRRIEKALA